MATPDLPTRGRWPTDRSAVPISRCSPRFHQVPPGGLGHYRPILRHSFNSKSTRDTTIRQMSMHSRRPSTRVRRWRPARTFHSAGVSFRHIGHGVPGSRPPSRDKVQGSSCRPDSVRSFNQIFPPSRPSSKHRALSIIQLLIHSAIFSAKFSSNKFIKFHIILK